MRPHRGGFGEGGDSLLALEVVRNRCAGMLHSRLGIAIVDGHETVRLVKGQGLEQDRVDDREYRDVGGETKGEDQQDGEGETLLTGQAGDGLTDITQERFD